MLTKYSNIFKPEYILFILTRNQLSSVVRKGTEAGATMKEQGRPRKHINFAGKPVLKIILYGNGLNQGYSTYGGSK